MEIFNKLLQFFYVMGPLISVVIPTYNRAEQVVKAVNSVLSQSYENFEVLICDDGSTDDTKEAVESINDKRIIYLKQENKGPGAARNLGLRSAKGELIAFLDSDDSWTSEHLEVCVEFFELYHEASMVYTQNEVVFSEDSRRKPDNYTYKREDIPHVEKKEGFWLYDGLMFDKYLNCCISATPCTVVKKSVFDDLGMFDEGLSSGQDYDMWLRVSNKYRIGIVKKPTVKVLAQGDSVSEKTPGEKVRRNKLNIYNNVKKKCKLNEEQERFVDQKIKELSE